MRINKPKNTSSINRQTTMIAVLGNGFVGNCLSMQINARIITKKDNILSTVEKLFVCAPTGNRLLVRNNPEKDLSDVHSVANKIKLINPKKCILIGTVDSLLNNNHPYSKNRRLLEELYDFNIIIRLPNLIHNDIRKNLLWDLKHQTWLDSHNLNSTQQWYDLNQLSTDIEHVEKIDHKQYNLVSAPIANKNIVKQFCPQLLPKLANSDKNIVHYNIHNNGNYHSNLQSIYKSMETYLKRSDEY